MNSIESLQRLRELNQSKDKEKYFKEIEKDLIRLEKLKQELQKSCEYADKNQAIFSLNLYEDNKELIEWIIK